MMVELRFVIRPRVIAVEDRDSGGGEAALPWREFSQEITGSTNQEGV
jgi:hypothetical protein